MFNVDKCRRRIMIFGYIGCNEKVEELHVIWCYLSIYIFEHLSVCIKICRLIFEVYTPYAARLPHKINFAIVVAGLICIKTWFWRTTHRSVCGTRFTEEIVSFSDIF